MFGWNPVRRWAGLTRSDDWIEGRGRPTSTAGRGSLLFWTIVWCWIFRQGGFRISSHLILLFLPFLFVLFLVLLFLVILLFLLLGFWLLFPMRGLHLTVRVVSYCWLTVFSRRRQTVLLTIWSPDLIVRSPITMIRSSVITVVWSPISVRSPGSVVFNPSL